MENQNKEQPKLQKRRYTDEEISFIKNTFRDDRLKSIRKSIYQLPLTQKDKNNLRELRKSKQAMAIIRKAILPELDGDAPFFQILDRYMNINGLMERTYEGFQPLLRAREKTIEYLDQEIKNLENDIQERGIIFNGLLPNREKGEKEMVDLLTRDGVISLVEYCLNDLHLLSLLEDETDEQRRERQGLNSNK